MINRLGGTALVLAVFASPAAAQFDDYRKLEIGGITGVLVNTQTITPSGGEDLEGADVDLTAVTVGADTAYYFSQRVGIGAFITYQSVSFGPADADRVKISGGLFGPLVKLRFPVGPRADVVVVGGGGLARTTITAGPSAADSTKTDGTFYMGGAGLSFFFADNAAFEVGARYQGSTLTVDDAEDGIKSAGFLVALGFSVFLR
jgi:hypothetical protein